MNKNLDYYIRLPYKIELQKAAEGDGFVFSCPDLKGCLTVADTLEQGYALIEDAKKCWIEACLAEGMPVPEPDALDDYSGQFKLRIPRSLHKHLAEHSRQEGISMNQYCLYLLSNGVGQSSR